MRLRRIVWEAISGFFADVDSVGQPLIKSVAGSLAEFLVVIFFSLTFLGLVDRQPSPPGSERQIGERPGFTFGEPTELFPYELFPVEVIVALGLSAFVIVVLHQQVSALNGFASHVSLLLITACYPGTVLSVLWMEFDYYTAINQVVPNSLGLIANNLPHFWLLGAVLLAQSTALFVILVLYQQPLFPAGVVPDSVRELQRFNQYMKGTWRLTQVGLSAGVAIAVGISLPILVETGINLLDTLLVTIALIAAVVAILLFPALKILYARKIRLDVTEHSPDQSRGYQ
jgi:hypothetical protein